MSRRKILDCDGGLDGHASIASRESMTTVRADGSGHKTWWLYFGTIAPNAFQDIDMDPSLWDAYFG